jgi:hypothetical protein
MKIQILEPIYCSKLDTTIKKGLILDESKLSDKLWEYLIKFLQNHKDKVRHYE